MCLGLLALALTPVMITGGIDLSVGAILTLSGLLASYFLSANTLSITIAQRMREFATLRTLGASRKQVMRSVVIEGLVIGDGAGIGQKMAADHRVPRPALAAEQ